MSIIRKVHAIERVFERLDIETSALSKNTGMHCLSGCGKCCMKPDIEASPIEFLPLALAWYGLGIAEKKLEEIAANPSSICAVFNAVHLSDKFGNCSEYQNRGLICRLFGYAMSRDKNGGNKLVTCRLIKLDQPEAYQAAINKIAQKEYLPSIMNYYQRLSQIDFKLANSMLPINEAIQVAIQEVMQYYSYRPFPKNKKAS